MPLFDIANLSGETWHWAVYFTAALLIGMSKTGLQGINTISIPLLALIFGAKQSTGVILPMLCFADLFAVVYYRRSAEWKYILRLLPYTVAGFFVAIAVERFVPASGFKRLMGLCILVGLVFMFKNDRDAKNENAASLTTRGWYAPLFGLLGGFSTMIGNAAGPIMSIFLLSMRLPKYSFVGTAAWYFFTVNLLKLPLQAFVWHNITPATLRLDLYTIPFIVVGAVAGVFLVKKIPEKAYRLFILVLTVISAVMLFI